jgi:hypothetical protein
LITLPVRRRPPNPLSLTSSLLKYAIRNTQYATSPQPTTNNRQPTTVHVFKPVGYSGLAAFALSALRVPWVLDMDDWEGPGGWADVNPYTPAQKLALTVMEAFLPRMGRTVTAASRALEARAWDFGLPRRRVFYVPNGVSQDRYAGWEPYRQDALLPQSAIHNPQLAEAAPTILLYTRFAEFPYWWPLDVLARVLQDHPTARLLVVGSGFFGEERRLQAEAARMGAWGWVSASSWPGTCRRRMCPRISRWETYASTRWPTT